jgi:hypothetical protein
MSAIDGLNSNSYLYNTTLNTSKNESNLLQDFGMSSSSSSPDLITMSNELNQLNQGIDPLEAAKYEPQSSQVGTASPQTTPLYTSVLSNYSSGLSLIQGMNQNSTTDSITRLSNELNLLDRGISESELSAFDNIVGETSTATETEMATLGNELNQLNNSINVSSPPATSNTLTPDNNILNYNYSPTAGININPYNTTTSSSTMDLKL